MDRHLSEFRALDLWENPEYSGKLGGEQVYDLILAATGNKEAAQKAGSQRAKDRMDLGLKP